MGIVICECCHKEFKKWDYEIKRTKHHFCSYKCKYQRPRNPNNINIINELYAEIIMESKRYGIHKTLIDIDDVEKASKYNWYAHFCPKGNRFYVICTINKKSFKLHRLLTDCPRGLVVDHINHDTLDNRKCNLRVCTHAENMRNCKPRKNSETPSLLEGVGNE